MRVLVVGAGVAGLACALELGEAGAEVEVIDKGDHLGASCCSWYAGGMLAPWCEAENAEPLITTMGQNALPWWRKHCPGLVQKGSLVVAQPRDRGELQRFARRTHRHRLLRGAELAALEPDLDGRFCEGLFFADEAHIDARAALTALVAALTDLDIPVHFGRTQETHTSSADQVVDCRGLAARDVLRDLRGVKGEMLLVRCPEIRLQRPIRLLHPRIPLYIVPRADDIYLVGATAIESDDRKSISARSMIELLQGCYALHPAFAAAEVVEIGTEVRPAFGDNLPRIRRRQSTVYVNGLYRHGYLLSPTLAQWTRDVVLNQGFFPEVMDEHPLQRQAGTD